MLRHSATDEWERVRRQGSYMSLVTVRHAQLIGLVGRHLGNRLGGHKQGFGVGRQPHMARVVSRRVNTRGHPPPGVNGLLER